MHACVSLCAVSLTYLFTHSITLHPSLLPTLSLCIFVSVCAEHGEIASLNSDCWLQDQKTSCRVKEREARWEGLPFLKRLSREQPVGSLFVNICTHVRTCVHELRYYYITTSMRTRAHTYTQMCTYVQKHGFSSLLCTRISCTKSLFRFFALHFGKRSGSCGLL